MNDFRAAISAASSGLRAQSQRLRIAAENVANANSTGETPGADPFRRRIPVFEAKLNRDTNATQVRVVRASFDPSAFRLRFEPGHPAADERGFVRYPNVDPLVEIADIREAQRAYEANLSVIETTRTIGARTLDIIRT